MPDCQTAVCTVVSKNHLHLARTMMESVKSVHPEWRRYVLLVDTLADEFQPQSECFRLIRLEDLPLPQQRRFFFRYSILELNCAVKPWLLEWILRREGADQIVYLDSDVCVYSPLTEVTRRLQEGALMVLTPHLRKRLDDRDRPSEHDILKAGCYNLGFLAVSGHARVHDFLAWWQDKLEHQCRIALAENLSGDQRWMDLAPCLFEDVSILRDDGYNAAYWNANQRQIKRLAGRWFANNRPLAFFHFSGFDPYSPDVLSRHQNRVQLGDTPDLKELVADYRSALSRNGLATCRDLTYGFDRLADGTPIFRAMRAYYREQASVQALVGDDPFAHRHEYLNEPWGTVKAPLITRLMRQVWEMRPDLQAAYPDLKTTMRLDFARAFVQQISKEEKIPDRFVASVRNSLGGFTADSAAAPNLTLATSWTVGKSYHHESYLRRLLRVAAWALAVGLPRSIVEGLAQGGLGRFRAVTRLLPRNLKQQLRSEVIVWLHRRHISRQAAGGALHSDGQPAGSGERDMAA